MLLRKQVSVRNGEKKLVVKKESRKYYLTVNVQMIVCCLRLTSDLKEWVKEEGTKFSHYMDVLSAIQGLQKSFTGLSNKN